MLNKLINQGTVVKTKRKT